jgi:sugar O-acyltransferase (sialic acid O-acetyltransferase NeuD family)
MKLIIYGSSDFGLQTYNLIKFHRSHDYEFTGFIDDTKTPGTVIVEGFTVLGGLSYLESYPFNIQDTAIFLSIGYKDLSARYRIFQKCKEIGFFFPNFIHPNAHIEEDLIIGEGNYIMAGAAIDQSVRVGDLNFIDLGCIVGHNSTIKNNNYVSAGTVIAGFASIGSNNFIGIQTSIADNIKIDNDNFINAASLIAGNIGSNRRVVTIIEQKQYELE